MRRLVASSLCLLALAVVPQMALGQSAGDDQYADPFAGQDQAQGNSGSSQGNGNQVAAQPDSDAGSPATSPAPAAETTTSQTAPSSGSGLAYTGFPAGLVALLGAFGLVAGLTIRAIAGPPPAPRRDAVLVLGRDVRLQPRARRR